jgi:hypothetical protein
LTVNAMQRVQKSLEPFPNLDPAWFALVEQRVDARRRWRRFTPDYMAAHLELATMRAAAQGRSIEAASRTTR